MNETSASERLAALGHPTRLGIFRTLVQAGPDGATAAAIAAGLGVPAGTLAVHLGRLRRAGLIEQIPGRAAVYVPRYEALEQVFGFITERCCGGRPGACAELVLPRPG